MIFQCILGFKDKFYHLLFRRLYIYNYIIYIICIDTCLYLSIK